MYNTIFVGLDVHKDTIAVAIAKAGREGAESLGIISNDSTSIIKLVRRLEKNGRKLAFCYEAGPCGYGLYRLIKGMGHDCEVVASSLVPQKPGDRIKTDRRDAQKLARNFRNGELTPVWVPDEDHEALRDLVRGRECVKEDLHRNRQRLSKFILRLGLRAPEGARNWSSKHWQWLKSLKLDNPAQQMVLCEYIHTIEECNGRIERFEKEIEEIMKTSVHHEILSALQGFRGIALVTAATIIAEVGDLKRFKKPGQLMSYTGLIPSEWSSGSNRIQGSITKCGNSHLRRVIVEAAWHYRHRPAIGVNLEKRQKGLPEEIKQISWKAQHRLNLKYRRMIGRGKTKQNTVVAVARELLGFIWAVGQIVGEDKEVCDVV